jgi:ferredoxin-NADP reductase
VSSRLVAAEVGMRLQVLGPSGEFTAGVGAGRHLVAIAGGSGITPIMSIARSVLAAEPESRVTLVYGNRTEADVIFAAELARMMAASGGRFAVEHVLGERMEVACVADADGYFVCGPEPMMVAARARLLAMGVDAARIKEERFSAPARRQEAQVTSAQPVTIRRAGVAMDVIVPAGQTLLDAGLAAGVPMKLSCAMGGCGACAVRLTAGEVVMDEPNCLGDAERARGLVLACVARPLSPCTVETEVQP